MKLIRFGALGAEKPGVIDAHGTWRDVSAYIDDYTPIFFQNEGLAKLRMLFNNDVSALPVVDPSTRLGAPVANPSKIICIGLNYIDHARETNAKIPTEPILFYKSTTALVGPNDDLVIPKGSEKTDWEVELAVVIGKRAKYVEQAQAMDYVAGYTLHNDYSERAFQLERNGQWMKGKGCDTFAPLGPYLATTNLVPDPQNLALWLKVNGVQKQNGNTSNMIFPVDFLVSYVSQFMTLLPGDVISTGTPAGVGLGFDPPQYIQPGDVMELGIDLLGSSRQVARAYDPARDV